MLVSVFFFALQMLSINNTSMIDPMVSESNNPSDSFVLQYLIREPKVKAEKNKAIILLHGVGSNEQDLFSLAGQLPDDFYIIAARGPFALGGGRFAWYNVDFSTGRPVIDVEQELSSRNTIHRFVSQIKQKYHIDQLYLGGFSQGAIMSFSVALTYPNEVNQVIALSGRILEQHQVGVVPNDSFRKLNVFLSHGTQDGTLPIQYAREAKTFLEKLNVQLSYHEYNLGHSINNDVLKDLNRWLQKNE
ncbi:alpha/beta fold hydrolase [Cytophagaceae bacterium YF14B1]|uniref:Alpha/beta fold hydrolase n=1 Tax=Xanthocytophaga flava TaxID=3048013 RepID=A0AAE3QNN8_9BACT|nr:alpha/beta fold hydrolase [Xanthocytophaga flavus]MDJ1482677.1 alpha/beta fold hydrolase [Xanthocytophaga flavus]